MANVLGSLDPIFYAQEGLIQLEKALGLAGRVHRGYDKTPQQKGSVITIHAPSSFTAQNAPSSAQELAVTDLSITLNQWKEVKFALTDKELSFTKEKIIGDHVRPAAYALADAVDQYMAGLMWKAIPWISGTFTAPAAVADITTARARMRNNKVPLDDPNFMHFMVSGTIEGELLANSAFSQYTGAGEQGVMTQMRGSLGQRFGFNFFANQNTPSITSATVADLAGAIDNGGGYAAGATTIHVDGITASAEIEAGAIVAITGHTQQYVVTAAAQADGNGDIDLTIYGSPHVQGGGLESAVVNDQVATITLSGGSGATKTQNLAFHRNMAALATAPLSEMGNELGARIATVADPVTGLSIRSRLYYDGDNSKVVVALDILYGGRALDGNLGVRVLD